MHEEKALIPRLEDPISGRVITPDIADYDQARVVFYPFFDRRPAVIIRPANAQDVSTAGSVAARPDWSWRWGVEATIWLVTE